MKILFKNADILHRGPEGYTVLKNGFLATDGALIAFIGESRPRGVFDREIDCSGKLALPGLYNCHTHAAMVALRGAGSDLPLNRWLRDVIFQREKNIRAETVLAASRLAIAEMLACGTVSFTDMYFFPEETARAVEESGVKANLTKHLQMTDEGSRARQIRESVEFFRSYHGAADGRIRVDFGVHAWYTCDFDTVSEYTALCAQSGARMHIHLSETDGEMNDCLARCGKTPVQWFRDAGAFRSPVTATHCVALTPEDIRILTENRVGVVHCPTSNMKLGSGPANVPELLRNGIKIALGTDGAASNNNLNLFEEMHLAALLHKGIFKDPTLLPTRTVLDMATVNGAAMQGREKCGALCEGYRADLVLLDMNRPHLIPNDDAAALLVYSAQGGDVCLTMADGKILFENGEYKTLDIERVMREAAAVRLF
ncbi:MAG: amidohydrolase [Clostridia bacterium]|nr:amidohydrolase [Clostridia bacterium]